MKKQLIERLGFKPDSWELAMVAPVAVKVGKVKDSARVAELIVDSVIKNVIPMDIKSKGEDVVKDYFNFYNYTAKLNFLIEAATAVAAKT